MTASSSVLITKNVFLQHIRPVSGIQKFARGTDCKHSPVSFAKYENNISTVVVIYV